MFKSDTKSLFNLIPNFAYKASRSEVDPTDIRPEALLELLRALPGAVAKIDSGSIDELTNTIELLFNIILDLKRFVFLNVNSLLCFFCQEFFVPPVCSRF